MRVPFTDAKLLGSFGKTGGAARTAVEGFCDSVDGSLFRIRFMPSSPGDYTYSVTYQQGDFQMPHTGRFRANKGQRRGPIRVVSEVSLAFHLGGHGRALLSQWNYRLLPSWLARRANHLQHY